MLMMNAFVAILWEDCRIKVSCNRSSSKSILEIHPWSIGACRAVWVPGQDLATPHLMRNCGKRILSLDCTLYVRLCVPHLSRKITYLVIVSGTNASPVSVSHHESPSYFFAMVGDHVSSHPVLVIRAHDSK